MNPETLRRLTAREPERFTFREWLAIAGTAAALAPLAFAALVAAMTL